MRPLSILPIHQADGGPDDAQLAVRAQGGDAWAEEALYRRHAAHIYHLAYRLLGARADAEDVVQEAFVAVLEHLGQLREPAAFRGWLARTALTLVYRRFRLRKLRRILGFEEAADRIALEPAAGASPEDRAQLAQLEALLARHPVKSRTCWVLHHVEGYTLEQAAQAASCSLATVKRRIAAVQAMIDDHVGAVLP